jgi:hypothetical protein
MGREAVYNVPLVDSLGDAGEPEGGEGDVKVPLGNRKGAVRMLAVLLHVFSLRGNACVQHSEATGQVSEITQSSGQVPKSGWASRKNVKNTVGGEGGKRVYVPLMSLSMSEFPGRSTL